MSSPHIDERASEWTQPVSAESPCGESARYDPEYEQVLDEMAKLEAIEPVEPNWKEVQNACSKLLRTRTKDMVLFGALCAALLRRERMAGLAAGLRAYRTILERHGADILPLASRAKARASAFSWLIQRLTKDLETYAFRPEEAEAADACRQEIAALEQLLRPELEDLFPRMGPLHERLAPMVAATASPQAPQPGGAGETPAPAVPAMDPETEALQTIRNACATIGRAAEFFAGQSGMLETEKKRIERRIQRAQLITQLGQRLAQLLQSELAEDPKEG